MKLRRRQTLTIAANLAGTAGLLVLLHGTAAAQQDIGANSTESEWRAQTALSFDQSMGAALAPQATPLANRPVADRTPSPQLPETAEGPADVTLEGQNLDSGSADEAATVLADSLVLQPDQTLIAAGGVVVWYQGARLVASRLIVDGESGELTIEGPIHLSRPGAADPEASAILIADSAQLDRELQDGIIRGARLVIAHQLQLASTQATRSDGGRFTRLDNVVTSACQICAEDPVPLWEIRARSITHDAETRMLHLEHPQFRAFGVPLASLPFTVTAPDPTVERRSGFLRPEIRTTSRLGFGLKVPYFVTFGDHADLTITPYFSTSRTRTLELRYRQAFTNGALEWSGAVTRDDIEPGETRGYLFGVAEFDLPRGYNLGVQVQIASDRGYLLDYDVTEADRLWSGVTLERIKRDKLVIARVGNYHSLRTYEDNDTSPAQVADALWQRRFTPRLVGGEAMMEWSLHAHRRPSDDNVEGRDVARASFGLDWRRNQILPGGFVGAGIFGLDTDLYRIAQDDKYEDVVLRATPTAGIELRWPLAGSSGGATHLVEPVAQLLWSPDHDEEDDIPNEDSRLIEFDEGNLFSTNRFPGWDARESGLRANLGVSWTRIDPQGWSLGLTGGRVFRQNADSQFPERSPLSGRRSDWLLAAHFDGGNGLALSNRALFDDSFEFSRNELRLGWIRPDLQISAGHLWIDSARFDSLDADISKNLDADVSELTANIGWKIANGWWGNAETRYDFSADRAQTASLDVTYRNECVSVEMGLSRRFTDSDNVRPETSFDVSVRLGGFGSQKDMPGTVARRSCMR